jgi:lambda family phage portal protein
MGLFDFLRRNPADTQVERRSAGHIVRPKRGTINVGERHFADAAQNNRLTSSWAVTPTTVDSYIFQHWNSLVARSRDQAEKSDHARKFLQLCRDNIAGPTGFTLQAQVKDPSGAADTLASDAVESSWAEFSKRGAYEITRSMSRADVERLIVTTVARDGECFAVKRRSKNLPHGLAIQLVDPVALDPTHFETLNNGNKVKHGIEFNEDEQPVAYWFRDWDERQVGYVLGTGKKYQRIAAEDVIHVFVVECIGQKRGLPWTRTALFRMRNLAAFEDAAIINARVGASKMGFFKRTDADPEDTDDLPMDAEPGVFEDIGDREFVQWSPQFPEQSIETFTRSCLRSISVGLGVSYNNLAGDLTSVNFSSIRQGALDEREVWKGLQQFFISAWCEQVYPEWLQMALLMEKIRVPARGGGSIALPFSKIDKFKQVAFTGRRWSWIDPKAEVDANAVAIGQKLVSRSEIIRQMGGDPDDVWAEIQREDATLEAMGIVPDLMPGSPAPAQPTAQDAGTTGA